MGKEFDITGQKFGRLTAIRLERIEPRKGGGTTHYWVCRCECGIEKIIRKAQLLNGKTNSCGCLQKEKAREVNKTHGLRKTKLYKKWLDIKKRCYNKNSQYYYCYGARGIKVCDEWLNDFKAFYDWSMANGYRDNLTIDRIDVNSNYEPSNCRWVSQKVQNRNSRHCHYLTYNNETHCLTEWAEIKNISADKIRNRLKRSWSVEKALNTP